MPPLSAFHRIRLSQKHRTQNIIKGGSLDRLSGQ
jgi:hypothetical protein